MFRCDLLVMTVRRNDEKGIGHSILWCCASFRIGAQPKSENILRSPVIVFDKGRKIDISGRKWENVGIQGEEWEFYNGLTFEGSRSIDSTPKGA